MSNEQRGMKKGTLFGVGLGPGDPELVTVKAARIIGEADVVAYHSARHGKSIARGIAEALNTTIFGLAIAVPCVIAHSYFTRRIERLTARMESVLADFVSAYAHQTPPAN